MTSQFYQDRFDRPFPVTMLFLECMSRIAGQEGEGSEGLLRAVLSKALVDARLVEGKPSSDDMLYVMRRLAELRQQNETKEGDPSGGASHEKRGFGSDYLKWLSDMDHQALCFHAAGYNLIEARRLYSEEDYETVVAVSRQKADSDWHDRVGWFEASLFGFGGGYGKGGNANENVFDLRKDRASAESALKAAGF
jgi:hypothetical protein